MINDKPINCRPIVFAALFDELRLAADSCGYGAGLTGSLARDCDVNWFPYKHDASSAEDLVNRLHELIGGELCGPWDKPHGRRSWVIQTGDLCFDFGVWPRLRDARWKCVDT